MWLIKLETNEDGSREPLIEWDEPAPLWGYALCSQKFYDVFYSHETAKGFVNITVEDDMVIAMELNQEAIDAYLESLNPVEEEVDIIEKLEEENKKLNEALTAQAEQIALLEGCVIELAQQLYS